MARRVRLVAAASALLCLANACLAQNDERVHDALVQLAQTPQSVPVAIEYQLCATALEGYQLQVALPLLIQYTPPAADSVVVAASAGAVELTVPLASISIGDTPPAYMDPDASGPHLDSAQGKAVTKLLAQHAATIKAFLAGADGTPSWSDGVLKSFAASIQSQLRARADLREVRAKPVTAPGEARWPALELCAGSTPAMTVTAAPRAEQLWARDAFPVDDLPQAQMVTEVLRNAAGVPIAYRQVAAQLATPPGTFSVAKAPSEKRAPQGPPGVKIVNGIPVTAGEMLWAVAFATRSADQKFAIFCGGTLIGDRWVLTAAHCPITERVTAIIGRVDVNGTGGVERGINAVWRHIDFTKAAAYDSDISLVELKDSVTIKPITLVSQPLAAPMTTTVIGWGATEQGGDPVPVLHRVELDVVSDGTCKDAYENEPTRISGNMYCANRARKDSCQGDSGGASLRAAPGSTWQIAGIVSFGKGCASASYPGVYTKLTAFSDWISDVELAVKRKQHQ